MSYNIDIMYSISFAPITRWEFCNIIYPINIFAASSFVYPLIKFLELNELIISIFGISL